MKEVIKTTLKGTPYVAGVAAFLYLGSIYPKFISVTMVSGLVLVLCYSAGLIATYNNSNGKRVR